MAEKETPKARAEGDKLPEENKKDPQDAMNTVSGKNKHQEAPKANAEGDKLPEEDEQ